MLLELIEILAKTFGPVLAEKIAKQIALGRPLDQITIDEFVKRSDARKVRVLVAMVKADEIMNAKKSK